MNIPDQLHPLELMRKCHTFWNAIRKDLPYRFPTTRKRKILELKLMLSEEKLSFFEASMKHLENDPLTISIFDWPLLSEWHEKFEQVSCWTHIYRASSCENKTDPTVQAILQRLDKIRLDIEKNPLKRRPSFLDIIHFRWTFSPIRAEAYYLLSRLKHLC